MIEAESAAPVPSSIQIGYTGTTPFQPGTMIAYLHQLLATTPQGLERFHAIFFNGEGGYLDDCIMGAGPSHHFSIRLREVFARALALGARGLIVAHNHPSGDCSPSTADLMATRKLLEVGRALDVELIDHLIVTRKKVYSMRAGGKL